MAAWPQKPTWHDTTSINAGNKYNAQDGVTVSDMNNIIENLLYLRKYGGRVNTLEANATVVGTTLKFNTEG